MCVTSENKYCTFAVLDIKVYYHPQNGNILLGLQPHAIFAYNLIVVSPIIFTSITCVNNDSFNHHTRRRNAHYKGSLRIQSHQCSENPKRNATTQKHNKNINDITTPPPPTSLWS